MIINPREFQAVLQAGGRGTRMGPRTERVPKPLLVVAGMSMVERLLRQLTASGIRQVSVITGWLGDQISSHLESLEGLPSDLELRFVRETTPRGNIGSLAVAARDDRPILFSFADLVTDLSFERLMRRHREQGCDVTLTSHYESHRLRLGEITADGDRVVAYREKPEKRFLICSGIAVFEPSVLTLIDRSRPVGISDFVSSVLAARLTVCHWQHGAFWMDVNSPEELAEAEVRASQVLAPAEGSQ
jgi:mannose-1-phosphate guanylyltransferase